MKQSEIWLLEAVNAALRAQSVTWQQRISRREWEEILFLAASHRMLPMVYQAVYNCPAAAEAPREVMGVYRVQAMQMMVTQTQKTAEFLPLLEALRAAGTEPMVVKGILCRRLYPNPDYRLSSDEDILLAPEHFPEAHRVLTQLGMRTKEPNSEGYEIPYHSDKGALYIELHRSLFPGEHPAFGEWNRFFRQAETKAVEVDGIPTLCHTDHMLYLIMHAFKHFIHSGFGLRQVCDIILFANAFGKEIDWLMVLDRCRQISAEQFAAGLFRIGWKYLGLDLEKSRLALQWQAIYVDEEPLLQDILQSGVYGARDLSRKHSGGITLRAVSAQKKGSKRGAMLCTVFPSARELEARYPYLKNKPLLLPVAWTDRLVTYGRETASTTANKPEESLRIGRRRVKLLRLYGVLDQEKI